MGDVIVKRWSELTPTEVYALSHLRTEVFCLEQSCSETELDWRDLEPETVHYFIQDADKRRMWAYLRTLRNDSAPRDSGPHDPHSGVDLSGVVVIGRVVTAAEHRGKGLASQLLQAVTDHHGEEPMLLHAQTHATGLYARHGFTEVGEEFLEAGIPHITMVRR